MHAGTRSTSSVRSLKSPITKTKTFVGCWTCRNRKVKCDATRPCCNRCSKAGFQCAGYGIKLFWISEGDTTRVSAIKRQAMTVLANPQPSLSPSLVEQYLDQIDDEQDGELGFHTVTIGPFSVFRTKSHSSLRDQESDVVRGVPPNALNEENQVEDTPKIMREQKFSVDGDSTVSIHKMRWTLPSFAMATCLNKGSERNSTTAFLMENYSQSVTAILQPIKRLQNIYMEIYFPMTTMVFENELWKAAAGCSNLPLAKIAIFFSTLSSSAFHLRALEHSSAFHDVGVHCRLKALVYLRGALHRFPNHSAAPQDSIKEELHATLAAMLTLVTADVMDGRMAEFWIHLDGAKQVLKQLQQQLLAPSNLQNLVAALRFLTVIAETTCITLTSLPWSGTVDFRFKIREIATARHALVYTYGITHDLASFIHYINVLSRHMSYYKSAQSEPPSSLVATCEDLRSALYSWNIISEDMSSISNEEPLTQLLAHEHILAFMEGIKIYFHTRILPCRPAAMTIQVRNVANHLNDIERIKRDTGYNDTMTASIAWPGFIASCEAAPTERGPWREWWRTMLQYRIGNLATLWSIVEKAWEIRDDGLEDIPAWMPVLKQSRRKILPI